MPYKDKEYGKTKARERAVRIKDKIKEYQKNWNKNKNNKNGYTLYVIEIKDILCGHSNLLKIGITNRLSRRLNQLKTDILELDVIFQRDGFDIDDDKYIISSMGLIYNIRVRYFI